MRNVPLSCDRYEHKIIFSQSRNWEKKQDICVTLGII